MAPLGTMGTKLPAAPELAGDRIAPASGDRSEARLRLRHVAAERVAPTFAEDVRRGLTSTPKFLYPKYFYDELGSRLFEAITALPEYYVTRAEAEILRAHAAEIAGSVPGPVRLVELGSGDGQKTRLLIEALIASQGPLEYLPIDISESAVQVSSRALLLAYPDLRVNAYVGEYHSAMAEIHRKGSQGVHTLVLFLGSTLGNLDPDERRALLSDIRRLLEPGDALLLGVDLKKPEDVLIPAYDDPLGVTAAFNLNLLARINRELEGGFDVKAFRHRALYNRTAGRIEMHLESREDQTVPVRGLDLEIPFTKGETIFTESSYKFDLGQIAALASWSGFELRRTWKDSAGRFASNLFAAL
ncbi:MAG TPA: L-histidine N(alpha)-methyltransferase [Thermoanaerobaculia bacterium]|nr:L-histidine N(alpha)-methyltransferase [Thermoanaerobaculia bacterium]